MVTSPYIIYIFLPASQILFSNRYFSYKWLLQRISASVIHNTTWSHHAPITISIVDSTQQWKTYFWCANNYILQHPNYTPELSVQLIKFIEQNTGTVSDPSVVWNVHKAYIQDILLKMSSHCKKKRTQHLDTLMSQITNVENQNKANPHPKHWAQLLSLRQELRTLLLHNLGQNKSHIVLHLKQSR